MTPQMRARIDAQIEQNIEQLQAQGRMPPALLQALPVAPVLLDWPLRPAAGYNEPDYRGISNCVDLDPTYPNHLLDYTCGARTYDQAGGYNHAGIDIFLWPYPWILMDQGAVQIVAAAPGTIVGKVDGNDDRSCPNNYSANWNAVYVQHADGTVAWKGHMRKFSQTAKTISQGVAVGEYLGQVGSAGFSRTAPALRAAFFQPCRLLRARRKFRHVQQRAFAIPQSACVFRLEDQSTGDAFGDSQPGCGLPESD